ncbi:MAG: GNAT family N-acetyltransferase [Candidatus Dormibacter sp.]
MGIGFRRLERADFPLLARWQGEPHVARWWGPGPDLAAFETEYGPGIDGTDPTQVFLAELEGRPAGLIQRYRNRDHPSWDQQVQVPNAVSIDYYLGEPHLIGKGIGPQMIAAFVEQLFADYVDITSVTVGVLQENRPSWRALEKAGFVRVRSQHLESDEPWDRGPGYVYALSRCEKRGIPWSS